MDPDQIRAYSKEAIDATMAGLGSPEEAIAEENRVLALMGMRPDVITKLELKELSHLVKAGVRPDTVEIDKKSY